MYLGVALMGFIKMLIGVPVVVVLLVFSFVNNDLATFSLWPFSIEITVSLSVAVLFFVFTGFVFGALFSWLSYAPVRASLRHQKKQNKRLNKEQQKLVKEMEVLQENLETLKEVESSQPKSGFGERIKKFFSSSKAETSEQTENRG